MKQRKSQLAAGPGDFLPILISCVMLFLSLPTFLVLLISPDKDSGTIAKPLLLILGAGIVLGLGFLILGLQLLARPGSLVYRLAHGRFFGP